MFTLILKEYSEAITHSCTTKQVNSVHATKYYVAEKERTKLAKTFIEMIVRKHD